VDFVGGALNYHGYGLAPGSAFQNAASDGKDIGVDFVKLDSAMNAVRCEMGPNSTFEAKRATDLISVYPNPASDVVHVNMPEGSSGRWFVLDMVGKVLGEGEVREGVMDINASNLKPGAYVFTARTAKRQYNALFVVVRN